MYYRDFTHPWRAELLRPFFRATSTAGSQNPAQLHGSHGAPQEPPLTQRIAYNARVERVAGALKTEFKDANVFLFDVHSLFNQALDNPKRFKQLNGILNTKEFCPVYAL